MDFDYMRKQKWYNDTNASWNKSGVNHPDNIGYLCAAVQELEPPNYEEWKKYFKKNIADDKKIFELAMTFKEQVLKDFSGSGFYTYMLDDLYIQMTECRLIYETWLGYHAEVFTINEVLKQLPGYSYRHLSPKEDNMFAVDYVLQKDDVDICGIQVKSVKYRDSKRDILTQTKEMNKKKNMKFTKKYQLPVFYVYYKAMYPKIQIDQESIDTLRHSI